MTSVLYGVPVLPEAEEFSDTEEYSEEHRGKIGKEMDERLALVSAWLDNPLEKPTNLADAQVRNFVRFATHFFKENGRVYCKSLEGEHKLVIKKSRQVHIMKSSHDYLGHWGVYTTMELIKQRFWWPELE